MPGKLLQYPDLDLAKIVGVVGIVNGGTDGDTAPEAVTNLGGISRSSIGQANGPVPLDVDGKINISFFSNINSSFVTITGPGTLQYNQTGSYTITNFDSFKTYTLSAVVGTVSRIGNIIEYTAPNTGSVGGFTVNERSIELNIGAPPKSIATPSITSPANNAGNISNVPSFTSSVYAPINGTGIHQSSDWQISEVFDFSTTVDYIVSNTTHKTSWDSLQTILKLNTAHYVRVRYRSADGIVSPWSAAINFTVFDLTALTINIAPSATSINEGNSVTFTVTVTGIPNTSKLRYGISSNASASAVDFGDGSSANFPSGVITFNNNVASFAVNTFADALNESNETFYAEVYGRSKYRSGVSNTFIDAANLIHYANSGNVTIVNVTASNYLVLVKHPNGAIINYPETVIEGSTVHFVITTTNVPNGTVLHWYLNAGDQTYNPVYFSEFDGSDSGTVTINNNSGLIIKTIGVDAFVEPTAELILFYLSTVAITDISSINNSLAWASLYIADSPPEPDWIIDGHLADPVPLFQNVTVGPSSDGLRLCHTNYPMVSSMISSGSLPPGTYIIVSPDPYQEGFFYPSGGNYDIALRGIPTTLGTYTATITLFNANYYTGAPFQYQQSFTMTFEVTAI